MLGETLKDRYRVDRTLAQGGGGIVYQAFDIKHQRQVALKQSTLSDAYFQRAFIREAKLLKALHHPAFPEVYDQFDLKDSLFLVMEYFPGKNLARELIDKKEPFPLDKVLHWALILLDALQYLHRFDPDHPIIHRDIKPENLKLNETNIIRRSEIILLDFGIAKGAAENISMRSAEISIVGGTRHYAAPEQLFKIDALLGKLSEHPHRLRPFKDRRTDARSDLYSLAATVYNLLTKTLPPDAVDRAKHLWNNRPDPLLPIHEINPKVPPLISHIIHRAMSFEPEARFASADELRSALAGESNDTTFIPSSTSVPPPNNSALSKTTVAANPKMRESDATRLAVLPARYGVVGKCESAVRSIAFSPSGAHLASGSNDGMLRLWDVVTGDVKIIHQCESGETGLDYVSSVSFAPDGNSVASVGSDRAVRLSRLSSDTEHEHSVLAVCSNTPRSVAFSPCGTYLATGSSDGAVHLWNLASGDTVLLGRCVGAVWSLAFIPATASGLSVAAESDDGAILIWHLETRRVTRMQTLHSDIRSIAVSPKGELIVAGSLDGYLSIAKFGDQSMAVLTACESGVRSLSFSPDGSRIAIGGEDKLVRVFDLHTRTMCVLGKCDDVVSAVAFRSDGLTVASGSWDKTVRLWDSNQKIS